MTWPANALVAERHMTLASERHPIKVSTAPVLDGQLLPDEQQAGDCVQAHKLRHQQHQRRRVAHRADCGKHLRADGGRFNRLAAEA